MRRLVAVVGVAVALVAGVAPAASAGTSQCSDGDACVWQNFTYSGSFRGMVNDAYDYNNIQWEAGLLATFYITRDSVSSVRSQGRNCYVRFTDGVGHSGKAIDFRRVADGRDYQDPNLSNGGGLGTWRAENWDNRIASHWFFNCV